MMARKSCYHATSHASTQANGKTDGDVGSVFRRRALYVF